MPRTFSTPETIAADRAYRRQWYARNADYAKARVVERRKALKAWLVSHRSDLACSVCGESDPDCLDFHHVDPAQKDANIAHAIHAGWSIERMKREIAKCIIFCANCHRKHHAAEKRAAAA